MTLSAVADHRRKAHEEGSATAGKTGTACILGPVPGAAFVDGWKAPPATMGVVALWIECPRHEPR